MDEKARVVVTDIEMPFLSMVWFIFKWTLAAIPALIAIGVFFMVLSVLLGLNFTSRF